MDFYNKLNMDFYNPNLILLHKGGAFTNFDDFLHTPATGTLQIPASLFSHKTELSHQLELAHRLDKQKATGIIIGHGELKEGEFIVVPDNITIYPVVTCGLKATHNKLFSDTENRRKFYDINLRHELTLFQDNYDRVYQPGSIMPQQYYYFDSEFEDDTFFHSGIITDSLKNLNDEEKIQLCGSIDKFDKYFQEQFAFPLIKDNPELVKKIATKSNNHSILKSEDYKEPFLLSDILKKIDEHIKNASEIPKKYILLSCRTSSDRDCPNKPFIIYDSYHEYCFPRGQKDFLSQTRSTSQEEFHINFKKHISELHTLLDSIKNSKLNLDEYSIESDQFSNFILENGHTAFTEWEKKYTEITNQEYIQLKKYKILHLIFYIVSVIFKKINVHISYLLIVEYFLEIINDILEKGTTDFFEVCLLQYIYEYNNKPLFQTSTEPDILPSIIENIYKDIHDKIVMDTQAEATQTEATQAETTQAETTQTEEDTTDIDVFFKKLDKKKKKKKAKLVQS